MGSSLGSYEIARSGLNVSERGLNVTGHNISNINTTGYVRQQAMIEAAPYINQYSRSGMYQLGLGADIQQIRQTRMTFLDNIYRQENTTLGYWQARNKTMEDVQTILGEPMGDGLQSMMNQFWNSWQELSKEPDSLTVRALLKQRGEQLVNQINHTGQQLDKLQADLNSEICTRISEINDITKNIANLNGEIVRNEVTGDCANDYRDQRNALVDKLTGLVNADVTEMNDGQLAITVGGYFLVDKGHSTELSAEEKQFGSSFVVPKIKGTSIEVPIASGTLKGLLTSRGEVSGSEGSIENGSPYDKVDLVYAINRDATTDQKNDLISNIDSIVNNYKQKGIDVRLGFVEYDGAGYSTPVFAADATDFKNKVSSMAPYTAGTDMGYESLQAMEGMSFRGGAAVQFVVMSNSTMDETAAQVSDLAYELQSKNIKVSVVGSSAAVSTQLQPLADKTGGSYYGIATSIIPPATSTGIDTATSGVYDNIHDTIYNNIFSTQNIISDLRNRLNLMVSVMAREVNSIHQSGTTLKGLPGGNFFSAINSAYPIEIGNIKLDDSITSSTGLNDIVASVSGKNGDNTIALQIANLRSQALIGKTGQTVSIDDFYRQIIQDVGSIGNEAANISDNQNKLVQSADNNRQAIMGVSMDEEMSNMMKYKFAYDAASRALNVIDQMIETVVTRMGLVGR